MPKGIPYIPAYRSTRCISRGQNLLSKCINHSIIIYYATILAAQVDPNFLVVFFVHKIRLVRQNIRYLGHTGI